MSSGKQWLSYNHLFNLFFFLFFFQITCLHTQLCTQEQTSSLLQFKQLFSINRSVSSGCDAFGTPSHPKMKSWKKGSDCCSWDGVKCDNKTGHVIGLDLSCSWLQGIIHPNSSLFSYFPYLQKVNLAFNDFAMSRIPSAFSQFTRLTHLNLSSSNFHGEVPIETTFLNKLVSLDLSENTNLSLCKGGFQTLIQNLTKIRVLDLGMVNMSMVVPNSLLNRTCVRILRLNEVGLHGEFPNGMFELPHLQELDVRYNEVLTGNPNFINASGALQYLFLSYTAFSGTLSNSIGNLKSLEEFFAHNCGFYGSIPTSIGNLTHLSSLNLAYNNFDGVLSSSLPNLKTLTYLSLSNNHFTGPFVLAVNLTNLHRLDVSNNNLTGPLPSNLIAPPNLYYLNASQNLINGTIPSWIFSSLELEYLNLRFNKLVGPIDEFQSTWLISINLSNNNLHGTVPSSTLGLPNLNHLFLSSNNLSGSILESKNLSGSLSVLELHKNNFSGTIHISFAMGNSLKLINLYGNGFEGSIPKSLVNCINLEFLDFGRNKFIGKFPHWLGKLPNLQVLILQSNKFHGSISTPKTKFLFPMLRVLDMSHNHFTGPLPIKYFKSFKAMRNVDELHFRLKYMGTETDSRARGGFLFSEYHYSMTFVIKGSTTEMEKVLTIFTAIDLSRNNFQGEIPQIIGGLNSIRGLNLSYNSLTGSIPNSLGNLTKLEWLDLSSNKLTGEIPPQLTNLNFLGTLNLSHNRLTGPIPRGKQFDTFSNYSFIDNLALCGPPLSNTCSDPQEAQPPPSTFRKEEDSEDGSGLCWEVILPGYGFGLVIGLVMGYLIFTFEKPEWLVKMVEGVGNRNGKRLRSNARRHGGRIN